MAVAEQTYTPRLKQLYLDEVRARLKDELGYSSIMEVPRVSKITLNMGVGEAKTDAKVLDAANDQLTTIAGQRAQVRRARKSIASFKLREGMPVGVKVTLRGDRMYEFLDRLINIALPRVRDFRGVSTKAFDGRGNYTLGVRDHFIFPEIDYARTDKSKGLNVTIVTTAGRDDRARALLQALGMPFGR
jgi:large subunit ribosomal protein L5